jgi:hypothetical protein
VTYECNHRSSYRLINASKPPPSETGLVNVSHMLSNLVMIFASEASSVGGVNEVGFEREVSSEREVVGRELRMLTPHPAPRTRKEKRRLATSIELDRRGMTEEGERTRTDHQPELSIHIMTVHQNPTHLQLLPLYQPIDVIRPLDPHPYPSFPSLVKVWIERLADRQPRQVLDEDDPGCLSKGEGRKEGELEAARGGKPCVAASASSSHLEGGSREREGG